MDEFFKSYINTSDFYENLSLLLMRTKLIITSILFLLFAILASQNTVTTQLCIFFWNIQAPVIVLIVVVFIIGLVIGIIICSVYDRRKVREEKEISKTER